MIESIENLAPDLLSYINPYFPILRDVQYKKTSLSTEDAFNIYTIRQRLLEESQNKEPNMDFSALLTELKSCEDELILIHMFILGKKALIVFTNLNEDKILGSIGG